MMQIEVSNLGKRYKREWIFRKLSYLFESNSKTAIIGSNGSGKSTLLKVLSAAELLSEGTIDYSRGGESIHASNVYSQLSFSAPYMDLPEQLNPSELFHFHSSFKKFQRNISKTDFLKLIYLEEAKNKEIKHFSSGMKQRLKLGLAICSEASLLILDEPCSNLDKAGVACYQRLMDDFGKNRTVLIGSNEQSDELLGVKQFIDLLDYK